jgi:hypothetical protein
MDITEFVTKIIGILDSNNIDFIIHGAIAMGIHGVVRATGDLDIIVITESKNIINIFTNSGFEKEYSKMTETGVVYKFKYDRWKLDVFVESSIVYWLKLKFRSLKFNWYDYHIKVISIEDLIKNKLKRGSPQDLMDVHNLRFLRKLKK